MKRIDSKYINIDYFTTNLQLDADALEEVLRLMAENLEELNAQLAQHLSQQAWPELAFVAHQLKSQVGLLGRWELEQPLKSIQIDILNQEQLSNIPERTRLMIRQIEVMIEELHRVVN